MRKADLHNQYGINLKYILLVSQNQFPLIKYCISQISMNSVVSKSILFLFSRSVSVKHLTGNSNNHY